LNAPFEYSDPIPGSGKYHSSKYATTAAKKSGFVSAAREDAQDTSAPDPYAVVQGVISTSD
jgi:hypothetical protein